MTARLRTYQSRTRTVYNNTARLNEWNPGDVAPKKALKPAKQDPSILT
jgi:hypothetical protein